MSLPSGTNQQIAQHSTGPITPAGKEASSRNSFRHGLTAASIVMVDGESAEDFLQVANTLMAEHKPTTVTEEALVEKMIQGVWLGKRATNLQQRLFLTTPEPDEKKLALYIRYQNMHDRAFYKAFHELRLMRADQLRESREQDPGFVSQAQKRELHTAKIRHLNIRSEAKQIELEHGKIRNARLLAASAAASSVSGPVSNPA